MFIQIIISLIILGLLLYLVNLLPLEGWIKQVIHVVAIIAVILWLLRLLGVPMGI